MNLCNCPKCKKNLIIPPEIMDMDYLECLECGEVFNNPIKHSKRAKRITPKQIRIIVIILAAMWLLGKISMQLDAGTTKTFEQRDRTEIYYYDDNGNVAKRETIYRDGRPTKIDYY